MAVTLKGQTAVYEGTSTDTKPTDADNNAIFKELDTGISYYYDGTDWNEIPSSGGGGGGTGTDNYNELNNKPSINGTVLSGNKSLDNLGIQAKLTFDSAPTEDSEKPVESGGVYSALAGKQDTISDLSTIRSGAAAGATAVQPAALETALAQKQDALSSEQLDAVNSGVTSADVEQITTNKNNILSQQNSVAEGGQGYAIINGQRLYMGATQMPERIGDIWLDGATVRESEYLLTVNPLCGIRDYKDTLNLATGACTRNIVRIKASDISWENGATANYNFWQGTLVAPKLAGSGEMTMLCNKYRAGATRNNMSDGDIASYNTSNTEIIVVRDDRYSSAADWLAANGNDMYIWYILLTPETETITIPSGNTGTVEGYLIQSGTPTPSAPIYPTANEVPVWE
jgi:hypothetical protein